MTLDEIIHALETCKSLPREALKQAMERSTDLAPRIIELLEKLSRGVFLTPRQSHLLFFGLHALAAGGGTNAFRPLVQALHRGNEDLEPVFGDMLTETLNGVLIGLFDGDATPLYAYLELDEPDEAIAWSMLQGLAYLVWTGRAPRDRFIALLRRLAETEAKRPGESPLVRGWRDAIELLGLEELRQTVIDHWVVDPDDRVEALDRQDWIDRFTADASEQKFHAGHVRPFTDPVAALSWIRDEVATPPDEPGARLSGEEIDWLQGLLMSEQAPHTTMALEQVDGFLWALAVGPQPVPSSHWMPRIFDPSGEFTITYDSQDQLEYTVLLLIKHWNSITHALSTAEPCRPLLTRDSFRPGGLWAAGFLLGMQDQQDHWQRSMRDEFVGEGVGAIMSLCAEEFDLEYEPATDELSDGDRQSILAALPSILTIFNQARRVRTPVRQGPKVQRNAKCPCGSGLKYKACCLDKEAVEVSLPH